MLLRSHHVEPGGGEGRVGVSVLWTFIAGKKKARVCCQTHAVITLSTSRMQFGSPRTLAASCLEQAANNLPHLFRLANI